MKKTLFFLLALVFVVAVNAFAFTAVSVYNSSYTSAYAGGMAGTTGWYHATRPLPRLVAKGAPITVLSMWGSAGDRTMSCPSRMPISTPIATKMPAGGMETLVPMPTPKGRRSQSSIFSAGKG